jgi:hypothetical protein
MIPLPEHIVQDYGSSRAFKAAKRKQLRILKRALNDLRMGCAYFPVSGSSLVQVIDQQVRTLEWELAAKNWGR